MLTDSTEEIKLKGYAIFFKGKSCSQEKEFQ